MGVSADLAPLARRRVIPELGGGRRLDAVPVAVAHARIVARLRERGHNLEDIREAGEQGRLAYGYIEAMFGATTAPVAARGARRPTSSRR